ncbi:SDR family NAD(P)-dependent oxidoreductase [Gordonia paraffinivorans]|uniref:3-oxoacyl-[acyl-carrier-protein] reductase MabA n=1 Tax=Gordonia paraffinivorans TaxID=175628 RepID=A0ABD7V2V2_9ACTN|nr:SDR family oxidoreductase [Gordonia paraffinivorans]VFA88687.1 3-oxoacyl-[acyl-carrier-protein] reductase FabG [Gordonia paraffinivorans]
MTDWSTKRVLVTGGSRGIGEGIAATFLGAGARVAIAGRNPAALEAARSRLEYGLGSECLTIEADVSDPQSCRTMAAQAVELLGGLDIVCANAGIYPETSLSELTETDLHRMFAINTYGAIYTTQACLPALAEAGNGRVVLTSSITGPVTGYSGLSHYSASKAAQLGFMRSAALELAPSGVTVNAVLPGSIRTEGLDGLGEAAIARMIEAIPARRLGMPGDIGAAAMYFASDEAAFVTGQTLVVDGGQTLPEHADAF